MDKIGYNMITTWYNEKEVEDLGLKYYGNNVLISRKTSIYTPELVSLGNNVRIDDFCILSGEIEIQDYNHIGAYTGLYGQNRIKIMEYAGTSARCLVYTISSDFSGEYFLTPTVPEQFTNPTQGPVTFEKFSCIGAGTIVLPNVTLKTGAVVGAMSLVTKDLEPWTINSGIPAKKINERKRNLINLEIKLKEYLIELNGKEKQMHT